MASLVLPNRSTTGTMNQKQKKERNRLPFFSTKSSTKKVGAAEGLIGGEVSNDPSLLNKSSQRLLRQQDQQRNPKESTRRPDADAPHCYSGRVLSCPHYRKEEVSETLNHKGSTKTMEKKKKNKATADVTVTDPPGYRLRRSETLQREVLRASRKNATR